MHNDPDLDLTHYKGLTYHRAIAVPIMEAHMSILRHVRNERRKSLKGLKEKEKEPCSKLHNREEC
jgi:hypothetical protein